MSLTNVLSFFEARGMKERVLVLSESTATVPEAANALGTEPRRIAKTLSFAGGEGCILVVAAGDAKVDNAKYKAEFAQKAKMLTADEAFEKTGHAVGGVCPFALPSAVKVYLDQSLCRFETVFPACGSANSAIALSPEELFKLCCAEKWVDVCKGWQEETC